MRIASGIFTNDLPAYATNTYYMKVGLPKNVPTGSYYVGTIVDDTRLVSEKFETDNSCASGMIHVQNDADLVATSISVSSRTPTRGSNINASVTIKNLGGGASKAGLGRFHLKWNGGTPNSYTDFVVADVQVPIIQPLGQVTLTPKLSIPSVLCGERSYYLSFHLAVFKLVPLRINIDLGVTQLYLIVKRFRKLNKEVVNCSHMC